jgi:tetratricopeptide (TPR) repeat protein
LKQLSVFLTVILTIVLLVPMFGMSARSLSGDSSTVSQLIAEGDIFAEKTFENQKAFELYNEALKLAPGDYEILWRLSRTYVDIGEHLPGKTDAEKKIQLEYYEKSFDYAKKAVEANPKAAMGYTRQAIANGRIALFRGVFESLSLVKQVRADCEKAIVLDATEPAAYYVLGRTHMKLCEKPKFVRWPLGIGWANMEDAVKNFEKAIELRPNFIMYRLDCARAYVELEEYGKAREQLTKIASLPKEDEDDDVFRKEAVAELEKIKDM